MLVMFSPSGTANHSFDAHHVLQVFTYVNRGHLQPSNQPQADGYKYRIMIDMTALKEG